MNYVDCAVYKSKMCRLQKSQNLKIDIQKNTNNLFILGNIFVWVEISRSKEEEKIIKVSSDCQFISKIAGASDEV